MSYLSDAHGSIISESVLIANYIIINVKGLPLSIVKSTKKPAHSGGVGGLG